MRMGGNISFLIQSIGNSFGKKTSALIRKSSSDKS